MKTKILLPGLIWLILVILSTSLYSQTAPTFYQGLKIRYQGRYLRAEFSGSSSGYNYYSVSCVADCNGDGKKDLFIGYFYQTGFISISILGLIVIRFSPERKSSRLAGPQFPWAMVDVLAPCRR